MRSLLAASRLIRSSAPSATPASRPSRDQGGGIGIWRAPTGMICWTLGITEHHNATDNVLALINLALLTGKVGRSPVG